MKILGISGGTKNGNNDAMCKEALMGAKEMGAEVEFIRLMDLEIKHCKGCTACVSALMSGKGNMCVLKDDFDWLLNEMLDADGIVVALPIFEKGVPGIFQTITDRFGPRMDKGTNVIADKIAEEKGGKALDPRILKDKVISYIGIAGSGSAWATKFQCSAAIQAITPMWKIINNEVFTYSAGIIVDDERVRIAHQIGANITNAAKNIENASYQGEEGVCPHCHSRNFYLDRESTHAICELCGIQGDIKIVEGKVKFQFSEEQLKHAHDTLSGKLIHGDDIGKNISKIFEMKKSDKYKQCLEKYKSFITETMPER